VTTIDVYPLTTSYVRQLADSTGTHWQDVWAAWISDDLQLTGRPSVDRLNVLNTTFPAMSAGTNKNN
jgi:hypothetical protein